MDKKRKSEQAEMSDGWDLSLDVQILSHAQGSGLADEDRKLTAWSTRGYHHGRIP
jgi:hypothetical protein